MLRSCALIFVTLFSVQSFAGSFDYLTGQSEPQKEFAPLSKVATIARL